MWPKYKRKRPYSHNSLYRALKCQNNNFSDFLILKKIVPSKIINPAKIKKYLQAVKFPVRLTIKFQYSQTFKLYSDVLKYEPTTSNNDDSGRGFSVIVYRGNDGIFQYVPPKSFKK